MFSFFSLQTEGDISFIIFNFNFIEFVACTEIINKTI